MGLFTNKDSHTVSLTAIGDILMHGRVYGGIKKKSGYNFTEQFRNVSNLLGNTDLTVANLETIIAGQSIGLSSFPKFNAPKEVGYLLKEMGVDLVSLANNHVLDRGEEGLLKSIENLKEIGIEYDGAYLSEVDKNRLRVFKINGLKVCFLSFTKGTNGIKIPKDKNYLVNSLKHTSVLKICKQIRKIKGDSIADIVIVNMHFGEEYHLNPSSSQREISASLSDAGADVIIGHHPHVVQPPEWIENSRGMKTFVAYSLGNFISGQNGLHRQIGAVLTLDIKKPNPKYKEIVIENPKYTLTFAQKEKRLKYGIYTFEDWIKENAYIKTDQKIFESEKVYNSVINRIKKKMPELSIR